MALIRIELTEQLGEGQYVEIRNPKTLPWGEQKKLQLSLKDQSMESQVAFAEQLAISLAKNGNVADENGNPIQFPLTGESLNDVPGAVLDAIALKFADIKKQGANVPKQ